MHFGCDSENLYLRLDLQKYTSLDVVVFFQAPLASVLRSGVISKGAKGHFGREVRDDTARFVGEFAANEVID